MTEAYVKLCLNPHPHGSEQVHAISNIISVLADRGDSIVVDEFAYVHVTECILVPKGLKMLPVSFIRDLWMNIRL